MSESQEPTPFVAPGLDELADLFPGYEFEGLIACGGMGAVYAAIQRSLDRHVAIKILPREFGNDEAFRAGFETEAKAMARLNHPNLIGVYDFGDVKGMLYIIMEYVPGQSLFHSSHGTAIDAGEVVRLITGICLGLAHAHQHGIIHRDIKPANILLDLHAEPKIGDFGLARPIENKIGEGEEIFGTPHYTAPEVVTAPQSVDHRADIFSVGVMLHELLTGRLPADDPRPPSAIVHCDPRFDAVVRRATDTNPDNRYTSAADLAEDLRKISTSPGPRILQTAASRTARTAPRAKSAPSTFHPRPSLPVKRSSPLPAILIVLLLAGVGIFLLVQRGKTGDRPDISSNDRQAAAAQSQHPPAIEPVAPPPEPAETKRPESDPEFDKPAATKRPDAGKTETARKEKEAPATLKPIFDVDGFLLRAKRIMASSASEIAAKRDQALDANLTAFKNEVGREIKSMPFKREREDATEAVDDAVADWQRDNRRIPPEVPDEIAHVLNIEDVQRNFFERQAKIDESFSSEIRALGEKYQVGIQMQIDRLDKKEDPDAVTLLEKEIQKARDKPRHFVSLVLPDEKEIRKQEFTGISDDFVDDDDDDDEDD